MSFGSALRVHRTGRGWSQERLAAELGVTKATISAWEGDRKLPESSRLPTLRTVLGVSLDALFTDDPSAPTVRDGDLEPYHQRPTFAEAMASLDTRQQDALLELVLAFQEGA